MRLSTLCALLCLCIGLCGCSDEKTGSLSFSVGSLFFTQTGQTQQTSYSSGNIPSVEISSVPSGWSASADPAARTVTVTAPASTDQGEALKGNVKLRGTDVNGVAHTATLYVALTEGIDLSGSQANCMLASQPNTIYRFDATLKGETDQKLPTETIEVIWQSARNLIQYLEYENDIVSFYIGTNDEDELPAGNALLAARDSQGNVIWTWHIWVTDYDPESDNQTYANGLRMMTRNLGAADNANGDTDEILASYGLYYQWGRMTPFIGPEAYDCARSTDATMYNGNNSRTYLTYVESSAETGTEAYALQNPMSFILGTEDSFYDWLHTAHSETLWGERKTVSDPCPKGWQVAPAQAFDGLRIADPLTAGDAELYLDAYGWNLTDGSITSFYLGAGRRSALLGAITNMNTNEVPKPWIGCYWSSGTGTDALTSRSLFFSLDTDDAAQSTLETDRDYARANGMQIRCVKAE